MCSVQSSHTYAAHTLIGNTAESHGVPDPAATHAALCELARRAFG